jgi:hypothetical protein
VHFIVTLVWVFVDSDAAMAAAEVIMISFGSGVLKFTVSESRAACVRYLLVCSVTFLR